MPFTAGQRIRASQLEAIEDAVSVVATNGTHIGGVSTTSTSFVALTSPGCSFVAPANGVVAVAFSSAVAGSGAGVSAWASFELRTGGTIGSGTIVRGAEDLTSVMCTGSNELQAGQCIFIGGLTPGALYNVRMMHRCGNPGTAFFNRRTITVMPFPGLA